ncbi:MAG: hypothetical protein ABI980_13510 [Nitrospirota bacterium]
MRKMTRTASSRQQDLLVPDTDSLEPFLGSARQMWCQAHPEAAKNHRMAFLDYKVSTQSLKRCADFMNQQDLPVVLGNNHIHVWTKPGSTSSEPMNLCLTIGIGAKRQDFIEATPTILKWLKRLTTAENGMGDCTGFDGVRKMLQDWKQAGETNSQIVARLHKDTVANLREAKDNPGNKEKFNLMCVRGLFEAFGLKHADILSCCKTALNNLRQNLDGFGPPTLRLHDRRSRHPQYEGFPITPDMVKDLLRHGRKWPVTKLPSKKRSSNSGGRKGSSVKRRALR